MTAALFLGGPRHLERWPVAVGPDGLPVETLLAPPQWTDRLREDVEPIVYSRREQGPFEAGDVWRYVHADYQPPRLARARGPAPAGVTLETVIEVVDGTELVFFGQSLGVIQTATPVPGTRGGEEFCLLGFPFVDLEYVAIVDPHIVDRVRSRHPQIDEFLTYETEEV